MQKYNGEGNLGSKGNLPYFYFLLAMQGEQTHLEFIRCGNNSIDFIENFLSNVRRSRRLFVQNLRDFLIVVGANFWWYVFSRKGAEIA